VVEGATDSTYADFFSLAAGDQQLRDRLTRGERLRVQSPFRYPGRRGPIVLDLIPWPDTEAFGPVPVRISDGGGLIRSLDEQGLDLSIDMIVSKTVVHAVKEVEGGGIGSGEVYLDSTSDSVAVDIWRLLQLICELLGLRHSKYKDALLQLSKRPEAGPDLIGWEDR
jgi:hypothetical protein